MTVTSTRPSRPEWDGPAFPPVDDAINVVKSIDWADVRRRTRKGLNNCGLVIAVLGEKIHDVGCWMAQL